MLSVKPKKINDPANAAKKIDDYWTPSQGVLGDPTFMSKLQVIRGGGGEVAGTAHTAGRSSRAGSVSAAGCGRHPFYRDCPGLGGVWMDGWRLDPVLCCAVLCCAGCREGQALLPACHPMPAC